MASIQPTRKKMEGENANMDPSYKAILWIFGMILTFCFLCGALITFNDAYKINGAKLIKYNDNGNITEIQK